MNLAQNFSPARPLARHCSELTERGPRPEERAESLASWRRDVAREVAQDMGDLLGGSRIDAQLAAPETLRGAAVLDRIGPIAANCLLRCGPGDVTLLLSFSLETAIALTDRSFGGTGEVEAGSDAPETLPRSAGLLVEQAGRTIAHAIARVSAQDQSADPGGSAGPIGEVIVRSESAARLKPFAAPCECALFRLDLAADDGVAWCGWIALPTERLDRLLPGLAAPHPARAVEQDASQAEIFGAIPIEMMAVLAEFELSLGDLDRLAPGASIPIAIPREIPLRIGSRLVGSGTLGTLEERMALRLTAMTAAPASAAPEEGLAR
jgi:flagellar motor switch/type III secretory pathway protein FliN